MANPDAEYIVERANPTDMTITVSRERFKDGAALPPLAYEARVVDLGREDQYGEAVTSLVLHSTDAPAIKPKAAGKNQEKARIALRSGYGPTQALSTSPAWICETYSRPKDFATSAARKCWSTSCPSARLTRSVGDTPSTRRCYEITRITRTHPNGVFRVPGKSTRNTRCVCKDTGFGCNLG